MSYRFSKSVEVESELCPGVVFTLRKITEARRSEYRISIAKLMDGLSDLSAQLKNLDSDKDEKELRRIKVEIDEYILRHIDPAKIKWAVKKIVGLEIETDEGFIEGTLDNILLWPSELRAEVIFLIDEGSVMLESEAKNYGPRTTFGAVVARKTTDSSAKSAGAQSTDSTPTETVPSSTPN
jgi:hypothetical protein